MKQKYGKQSNLKDRNRKKKKKRKSGKQRERG